MLMRWMIILSLLTPLMGICQTLYQPMSQKSCCRVHSVFHSPKITRVVPYIANACCRPYPPKIETVVHQTPDFSRVDAAGKLNLRLHTGARRAWISMHGDSRDLENLVWSVRKRTMILRFKYGAPLYGPVDVDLGMRHLDYLSYHGTGVITGHKISSEQLDLNIKNDAVTDLDGRINLGHVVLGGEGRMTIRSGLNRHLNLVLKDGVHVKIVGTTNLQTLKMSDRSYLSIYWVKAQTLRVMMRGKARAQIAGTAQEELVMLQGDANLNARYLRATEAFVKTYDNAIARIAVVNAQHALASDRSNIYYYSAPTYKNDFMAENGAILDLGTS